MSEVAIREAREEDLEAIVRLHADDALSGRGDGWSEQARPAYLAAFRAIAASPDNVLFVATRAGDVVGTFQVTLIPGIAGHGRTRLKIGGVQVRADLRGQGIGARMIAAAEAFGLERGAVQAELTSNERRGDAHRFYARLGYAPSHRGFTKAL